MKCLDYIFTHFRDTSYTLWSTFIPPPVLTCRSPKSWFLGPGKTTDGGHLQTVLEVSELKLEYEVPKKQRRDPKGVPLFSSLLHERETQTLQPLLILL